MRRTSFIITLAAVALFLCAAVAAAPAAAALELPLRIDTTLTLSEQFGYSPGYQLNVPSFDPSNRPVIRSRTASQHFTGSAVRLEDDAWVRSSLIAAVRSVYPRFTNTVNAGGYVSERIEFDSRGRAYTLLEIRVGGGKYYNVLLYSLDGCRTWKVVTLPFGGKRVLFDGRDSGTAAMEQYAGWNASSKPPLLAVWQPIAEQRGSWSSLNRLYVLKPYFRGGRLVLPPATLVSSRYIGQCYAAGGASFSASNGSTSFLVWPEVARRGQSGTPTYVGTFDQASRRMVGRKVLAFAKPRNDSHDAPGIVRDGDGYLHVVTGAHNAPFLYAHSVEPLDAKTWTTPEQVLDSGYVASGGSLPGVARQTYVSLACLPDNSLVLVYRQGRRGVDPDFGGGSYDALSWQRRSPDGVWSDAERLVFCSDRSGYALYNQKLTVDRLGRLYLSLSYFSPLDYPASERSANRFHHRMVLISKDGGGGWDFATDADFIEGIALSAE